MLGLGRLIAGILAPKVIEDVYDYVTGLFADDTGKATMIPDNGKAHYKKPDTTLFTQGMYDFAVTAYVIWSEGTGLHELKSQKDLTKYLNKVFGTDKSVSSMRRLFLGKIDRDTLAVGTTYEPKEVQ